MRLILLFSILLIPLVVPAQNSWTDFTDSENTYGEMIDQIESYFDVKGRGRGSGYKQFKRWKSVMDGRADQNKPIENYSALNFNAYQKALKKTNSSRSNTGDWENIGPFDYTSFDVFSGGGMGRVICTAFHPTNNSIFWVGTAAGGLWKTTNAGSTWTPMTDAFASIGISGIVVNQSNPDIIYVLTGDGRGRNSPSIGVLKTTNGGISWNKTDLDFPSAWNKYGFKIIAHPTNPEILFVAFVDMGLYKTTDGGSTFIQKIGGSMDTTVWDIEFIPGDANNMLVTTEYGLMRSLNGGHSWIVDNDASFPSSYARMDVAISPSQPQNVYVIFNGDTGTSGTFNGCYKSTDYGATFTLKSNTPNVFGWALDGQDNGDQGQRDLAFIVDPTDDSRLFVGGVNVWKSEDDGATWGRETWWTRNYEPSDPYVHADNQNFYWQGNTLFSNNDGGIYKTTDNGNDWTELSSGLAIGQFYEIDIYNGEYIGGLQDNGTMKGNFTDPESESIHGGDGFGCTWHTGDHSIKYLSTQASIIRRQFGSDIIIWDGFGDFAFWETEIEMDLSDADYFFLDRGNKLFRSHQLLFVWDFEWEDLGTDDVLSGGAIRGYAQSASNTDVMYVVNMDSIIKTTNLSASNPSWTILNITGLGSASLSDVIVDPTDDQRVWVTCFGYLSGKKVFYSDDGGLTWENVSGSIENVPIRCIEYGTNGVYIGTEIGMYYRGDNMTDWIPFANYLPNTMVVDIEIRGNDLYAGTFGRGIWRSEIYSDCPANYTLTAANDPSNPLSIGTQLYHASNNITSTRIIKGGLGTDVLYTSGNQTDLLPGFEVHSGNLFEIKIEGCPE